jgi:hypothetical protein
MRRLALPLACPLVAALSLLVPSAPTTDPWGWIFWGHQTAHLELDTDLNGSPSWKPLPVVFTTVFSLGGDAAPDLWLWFARTCGLLSLLVAFRVASRLAPRGTGMLAGLVAAEILLFSSGWLRSWLHGYTEPLMIGLLLAAVDRHLSGRRGQALLCAGAAALTRPEVFGPLLVYAFFAFEGPERWRWLGLAAAVPVLWIVPDWIGSGDPMNANNIAAKTPGYQTITPFGALGQGLRLMGIPALVLGGLGIALAARRRDNTVLGLAAVTLLTYLAIFLLMVFGYPHGPRFFAAPASYLCVLAGVGAALALAELRDRRVRQVVAIAAAVAALVWAGLATPGLVPIARGADKRAQLQMQLRKLARGVPAESLRGAYPAMPRGMNWNKVALAYELHVRPRNVLAVSTDARPFLTLLERGEDAPSEPPGHRVTVFASGKHGALLAFLPFGSARVRVKSHLRWHTRTVGSWRRWRAVLISPTRP